MLTLLRNSAQSWLIKALLGLIVVTFVISFGIGTFSNPKEVLVEVDGTEILVTQYTRAYQEELERLRQRFPDNAEALAAQIGLRQQVLDRMINRHLMLQRARAESLRVTPAELKETVTGQEAFQLEGRFDFGIYRQVLAQNRLTPTEYEERLREDLLLGKYQRGLISGIIVSQPEVDARYRVENERVEVDYVYVDPARIRLDKEPAPEAVQAYYDAHPDQFTRPTRFSVEYFALGLSALEEDVEVRDRAVERYYERNVETEFSTPAKVRASHILKRVAQDAAPDVVEAARKEMEGLLKQARAGADFGKLAQEHSEDLSAQQGGDLGYFTREDMVPDFADAAFALKEGEISNIVRTQFGLHIIKVTGRQSGSRQTLEQARPEILAKLRTQRAERKLDLALERLPGRIRSEGIEAVAKEHGLKVQRTALFDDRTVLEGLGSSAPLYAQLKQRKQGDAGVWRRNPVQGHVFYRIAERQEATLLPLDDVRAKAVEATRQQQRRERAVAQAKEAYQRLQDGGSLESFARPLGLKIATTSFTVVEPSVEGVGVNREFQRAAFGLTQDKPYAVNIKDDKAYLLRFKRRFFAQPDQAESKKQQIAERMESALREYVVSAEVERLRNQVKIDVLAPEYLGADAAAAAAARTN